MYTRLDITFLQPGTYKITAVPRGKVESSLGSACSEAEKTVYVGPQTVGNISGPTSLLCDPSGTPTYTITGNPKAVYNWSADAALRYRNPPVITATATGSSARFTADPGTIGATGFVRVTVTDCGVTTTRTLSVTRTAPPTGMSGPSSICVGNYGTYSAVDQFGSKYSWSVSPLPPSVSAPTAVRLT